MLNFEAKGWWTLAQHRLCPMIGDNVLCLICAALIPGYQFDVGEFLA